MENHLELTDTQFEEKFETCSLAPELFNHEAHLRLAWIHINRYGVETAVINIRKQLQKYAEHLGATNKYNETVTVAAIRAVYHFMLKSGTDNFKDFIAENNRLKNNFKDLLAFHYQADIFNSEVAKTSYLPPDLIAFD